ncbi:hypothetical protein QYE76_037318 [Lolium multiflorum]|uniref:DUF4218 domain-containing protein n=1 Tax=Lolium multiflorum TaxID=4521 RepID=A0AAD8PHL3_LOLMU|nr:hypothetical protein QYE76_037318 [Lolium multiflorum]
MVSNNKDKEPLKENIQDPELKKEDAREDEEVEEAPQEHQQATVASIGVISSPSNIKRSARIATGAVPRHYLAPRTSYPSHYNPYRNLIYDRQTERTPKVVLPSNWDINRSDTAGEKEPEAEEWGNNSKSWDSPSDRLLNRVEHNSEMIRNLIYRIDELQELIEKLLLRTIQIKQRRIPTVPVAGRPARPVEARRRSCSAASPQRRRACYSNAAAPPAQYYNAAARRVDAPPLRDRRLSPPRPHPQRRRPAISSTAPFTCIPNAAALGRRPAPPMLRPPFTRREDAAVKGRLCLKRGRQPLHLLSSRTTSEACRCAISLQDKHMEKVWGSESFIETACQHLLLLVGFDTLIYGKSNDTKEARQDQQSLKDPDDRHPEWFQGRASYALTKEEKVIFFECLSSMKVPSGFSSNIKGIINMAEKKFQNLKSHDCHVIMMQLLPIALRGLLPENVRVAIVKLCAFLNAISQKVINPEVLPRLQNDVVQCLVSFELVFPPSFFNIMTHLLVHLVEEISILGHVFLHNMFPFERFMGVLKKYVRNRARPEGSIAKGYGNEEVIEFCVDFVPDLKPIGLPRSRHEGRLSGKGTIGRKSTICMDDHSMTEAHHTVLTNSSLVAPYFEKHKNILRSDNPGKPESWIRKAHMETFGGWLRKI